MNLLFHSSKLNKIDMLRSLFLLLMGCTLAFSTSAQTATLTGRLLNSDREAVVAANVALWIGDSLSTWGAATDLDGRFTIERLPYGQYTLQTSYLGFAPFQQTIEVTAPTVELGAIHLSPTVGQLSEIVIQDQSHTPVFAPTGLAPTVATKYIVEPEQLNTITSPTNLIEALSLVAGVQEEVACGVCFTNAISINGLPGQYTAVLIDGTPMYGNLASIYALNGLPTTMIERIEVTKGPSSTIFGSEAVAGAINIVTKNPSTEPLVSLDFRGTTHLELLSNLSLAQRFGKWSTLVGIHHAYGDHFTDDNGDGFGDLIYLDRVSAFAKVQLKRPQNRRFTLFARYYFEDRRNGVEEFLVNRNYLRLRGDSNVYGESIFTRRWEVLGTYDLPTKAYLKLDYSFSGHDQDSYYGDAYYRATQYIGFLHGSWNHYVKGHGITAGLNLRYQHYDDNTIATADTLQGNLADQQFIPGIYLQDAWDVTPKLALLYGSRLDYYQGHGLIPAPRFNLKYQFDTWTALRFNFGTGFRIVNLFTEDHAFVTGSRQVELAEALEPERSYNASLNFNHVFTLGKTQGSINIDAYYTYFTNAIFPDYSIANRIVYRNLEGFAQTRGGSVNINQQFDFPLSWSLAANVQWATQSERDEQGVLQTSDIEYAPRYSGSLVVRYTLKKWGLAAAYTAQLTGPMALPEVYDIDAQGNLSTVARPTTSLPFSIHTLQLTKEFPKLRLTIYGGVQNIWDYRQAASPLVGYNDPTTTAGFSEHFDTAYAYSPIHGREFYLGIRWRAPKRTKK